MSGHASAVHVRPSPPARVSPRLLYIVPCRSLSLLPLEAGAAYTCTYHPTFYPHAGCLCSLNFSGPPMPSSQHCWLKLPYAPPHAFQFTQGMYSMLWASCRQYHPNPQIIHGHTVPKYSNLFQSRSLISILAIVRISPEVNLPILGRFGRKADTCVHPQLLTACMCTAIPGPMLVQGDAARRRWVKGLTGLFVHLTLAAVLGAASSAAAV